MDKVLTRRENGKYLWFGLLAMGFNPEAEMSSLQAKSSTKHINLGPAMFDKPNKDAFYIVTRFLLERLSPTRFNDLYRSCWPILDHKRDAEFRKITCTWLREIMDESANDGAKVQASLFLSPGGPKFVSLMCQLANHVMLQEMKTFKTDGTWVPEAAALPTSSLDMSKKRFSLIQTKFLETAVAQDCFLQEYKGKAQALARAKVELRAESAKYDELLKKRSHVTVPDQASLVEKATKVRALWSNIGEVTTSTQEEQHAVQCVLKGDVDQYTLDGSEKPLKIPPVLLERIQQLPQQLSSGNVYEDGQLNFLTVLELTNHALKLFKEEQSRVSQSGQAPLVPEQLQEKCQKMTHVLQDLLQIRQRISKEEVPEVKAAIKELELEWDRKWRDVLESTPLTAFLNEDPALGFMSPIAQLSFEPAPEASYKKSVFSQYPAKLLDKPVEKPSQHEIAKELSADLGHIHSANAADYSPVVSGETIQTSRANTSLDWLFDGSPSPPETKPAPNSKVQKPGAHSKVPEISPLRSRTEIIAKECDNLADQFAEAVATNSATPDQAKGLDLQHLLTTLHGDPFSTRKQLPRTPDSLIMDVKSSWRKAVAETEAERQQGNDSIVGRLTPLDNPSFHFQSPSFTNQGVPKSRIPANEDSSSICQQGALMKSNFGWDTFNTEMTDSPSGTGSSAVLFSLDHETLPELPSCDSLLSLEDLTNHEDQEESPRAVKDSEQSVQCTGGLFAGQVHTPENLLSTDIKALDTDWLIDHAKSEQNNDKRFSLGFDKLNSPSSPKRDYSLPKLITFSPIDDMKC